MIAAGKVRVEDDLRAARSGPADGFRIAKALVTDRDTKPEAVDLEHPAAVPRNVVPVLGGVELGLGLDTLKRAARVEHERRDLPAGRGHVLGAEDDGNPELTAQRPHRVENPRFVRGLERRHLEIQAAQSGHIGLRKARDRRALRHRIGHQPMYVIESFVDRLRNARRREGDSQMAGAHVLRSSELNSVICGGFATKSL